MTPIQTHPIIAIKIFNAWHYAIVATDMLGNITLVSFRGEKNRITEEPWHEVVGDRKWRYATEIQPAVTYPTMINHARSLIGFSGYNLLKRNCEHFVRWAAGLKVESIQVQNALAIGTIIAIFGGGLMFAKR